MTNPIKSSIIIERICHGSLVKRLRHQPLTLKTWVRFPYESPAQESRTMVLLFLFPVPVTRTSSNPAQRRNAHFVQWVRIRRAERVELARKRQANVYSSMMKFPRTSEHHNRGAFSISCAGDSYVIEPSASAKRESQWVRNIAPPLPGRKPCRAEQIPVRQK